MLHGTMIVTLLITAVPPKLLAGVPFAQPAPSTVACCRNPSSARLWMPVGATEKTGLLSVGSMNGATARGGGLAVPCAALVAASPTSMPTLSAASSATTGERLRWFEIVRSSVFIVDLPLRAAASLAASLVACPRPGWAGGFTARDAPRPAGGR